MSSGFGDWEHIALNLVNFVREGLPANPHDSGPSGRFRLYPFCLRTEVMGNETTAEPQAMVVHALMQEMTMEPDDRTGRDFYRNTVCVADTTCQLELPLL
jgi:hypothetical protein